MTTKSKAQSDTDPAPVASTKRPTQKHKRGLDFDPAPYAKAIAAIEADAAKAGVVLPKGASEAAILDAEMELGLELPSEVRAFYLAHDGGPKEALVCSGRQLLSLAGIVEHWTSWKELFDEEQLDSDDEAEPDEGVQQRWWIPQWVPVTSDDAGNHEVVDLAPDDGGEVGQIVAFWHDDSSRTLEGSDFLGWLAEQRWGE